MLLSSFDVKINKISEENNVGTFSFDPLPTGFGHTLGSSLRRILLTSLQGSAITEVKFDKALHEFTSVEGIKEDVVEIVLNLKKVRFRMHTDTPVVAKISKKGAGVITAADIEVSSEVEVLNKDLHIATLSDSKATLNAELTIESGVGYSAANERETSKVGTILVDAIYSPVLNVTYKVEDTRKGKESGLDKLVINVETDGSVNPEDSLTKASTLLRNFFSRFSEGVDPHEETEEVAEEEEVVSAVKVNEDVSLDELPLPTRTINALKKHGVKSLKQLAKLNDEEMADIKNLGDKSVKEIKKLLEKEGLK